MIRRTGVIAIRVSTVLYLAIIAMWIRSEFYCDSVRHGTFNRFYDIRSKRGVLALGVPWTWGMEGGMWNGEPHWSGQSRPADDDAGELLWGDGHPYLHAIDIGVAHHLYSGHGDFDSANWLVLPYAWLLVPPILPLGWRLVRRARVSHGPLGMAYTALCSAVAAGSLVICLVLAIAWVRSYWLSDCLNFAAPIDQGDATMPYGGPGIDRSIQCLRGTLYYKCQNGYSFGAGVAATRSWTRIPAAEAATYLPAASSFDAMDEYIHASPFAWHEHDLSTPIGWLVLAFSIPPVIYAYALRQRLRARRLAQLALCSVCGYDLRASTNRCPECGTAILANLQCQRERQSAADKHQPCRPGRSSPGTDDAC